MKLVTTSEHSPAPNWTETLWKILKVDQVAKFSTNDLIWSLHSTTLDLISIKTQEGSEGLSLNHGGGDSAILQRHLEPCGSQTQPEHPQHDLPGRSSESTTGYYLHIAAGLLSLLLLWSCWWMPVLLQRWSHSHKPTTGKEEEKEKWRPKRWRLVDLCQNWSSEPW